MWELIALWKEYEDAKKAGRVEEAARLHEYYQSLVARYREFEKKREAISNENLDKRLRQIERKLGLDADQSISEA